MSVISIMANRTVRGGIDDAPPAPMQLGNPDTGDFHSYEVDLLEEIGRRLDLPMVISLALSCTRADRTCLADIPPRLRGHPERCCLG